jgi:hypothetical protein
LQQREGYWATPAAKMQQWWLGTHSAAKQLSGRQPAHEQLTSGTQQAVIVDCQKQCQTRENFVHASIDPFLLSIAHQASCSAAQWTGMDAWGTTPDSFKQARLLVPMLKS